MRLLLLFRYPINDDTLKCGESLLAYGYDLGNIQPLISRHVCDCINLWVFYRYQLSVFHKSLVVCILVQILYDIYISISYVINFLRHSLTLNLLWLMMWLPDHHHCITGGSFLFYKNIFTNPQLNWGFMSCLFGDQLKLLAKIITPINLKGLMKLYIICFFV